MSSTGAVDQSRISRKQSRSDGPPSCWYLRDRGISQCLAEILLMRRRWHFAVRRRCAVVSFHDQTWRCCQSIRRWLPRHPVRCAGRVPCTRPRWRPVRESGGFGFDDVGAGRVVQRQRHRVAILRSSTTGNLICAPASESRSPSSPAINGCCGRFSDDGRELVFASQRSFPGSWTARAAFPPAAGKPPPHIHRRSAPASQNHCPR